MRRFTITTLGCKVNQYDGLAIATALGEAGIEPAAPGKTPDLVVINTCCVTTTAMRKSRQAIRRAVRTAPHAGVWVVGCYCSYHQQRIRQMLQTLHVPPQNTLLLSHHDDLAGQIRNWLRSGKPRPPKTTRTPQSIKSRRKKALHNNCPAGQHLPPLERFPGHQRAFVKVQDGCDAFCTYCIVPFTRPRVWSKSIRQVQAECCALVQAGHKEIVLCGVFLGAFGRGTAIRRKWRDRPGPLPQLLRTIAGINGLWRVRLSSLEPGDLSEDLLAVITDCPTVAPHLHLPLQSGADRILRRMNRQYSAGEFRQTVDRLRDRLDRPALTTDIIVGFPGESEEDFAETLALVEYAGFAKIHIFPYSAVEPTAAWRRRAEAAPAHVVRRRMAQLAQLEAQQAQACRKQFVGDVLEALVEGGSKHNLRRAMTDRYLRVEFDGRGADPTGQVVPIRIDAVTPQGLAGTLVR